MYIYTHKNIYAYIYTAHVHVVALVPYLSSIWNGSRFEDGICQHRYATRKFQVTDIVPKYRCCCFWLALHILYLQCSPPFTVPLQQYPLATKVLIIVTVVGLKFRIITFHWEST